MAAYNAALLGGKWGETPPHHLSTTHFTLTLTTLPLPTIHQLCLIYTYFVYYIPTVPTIHQICLLYNWFPRYTPTLPDIHLLCLLCHLYLLCLCYAYYSKHNLCMTNSAHCLLWITALSMQVIFAKLEPHPHPVFHSLHTAYTQSTQPKSQVMHSREQRREAQ